MVTGSSRSTYRVTAAVGGWRSLPWPFGLLDVEDDGLGIRSWHWSWWVSGRKASRNDILGIDVNRRFGVVTLLIRLKSGRPWKIRIANSPSRVLTDLRSRSYLETTNQ